MAAATLDLLIEQGASYEHRLTWKDSAGDPIDLTGFTARMQIRSSISSDDILLELTTENGMLTLGGTAGTVDLDISATVTAAIDWKRGVYDLEIVTGPDDANRLIQGKVTVSYEVTR